MDTKKVAKVAKNKKVTIVRYVITDAQKFNWDKHIQTIKHKKRWSLE